MVHGHNTEKITRLLLISSKVKSPARKPHRLRCDSVTSHELWFEDTCVAGSNRV
jgi:hypothetical protein